MTSRAVVSPRPAPARPPCTARGGRGRPGGRAVRARPRAARAGRRAAGRVPVPHAARAGRRPARARRPAGGAPRRPGAASCPPSAREARRRLGARERRLRPVRLGARRRRRAGARRRPLVRTGSPYAVGAGPRAEGRRRAVQGLLAVLPGLERARLARTRPRTIAGRVDWPTGRTASTSRPTRPAGRARAARGRRGRGAGRLAGLPHVTARVLRRRPRPPRSRPHLAHVGVPEVGLHPSAHDARRPRPRRRDVPQGARLARVLRDGAAPLAGRARASTTCRSSRR